MPVDFLSDDQAQRYGRYTDAPSSTQLARYFYLDEADLALIQERRGSHHRLGFAVQLATVRFLGTFLTDPTDVPLVAVRHLAQQLDIADIAVLTRYLEREPTRYEHAREIQQVYGYRTFTDQPEHFQLVRWLYTRAWLADERPSVLFDLTTAHLIERKILLPGVTVLTRQIAAVRERVATRLWRTLAGAVVPAQRTLLETLLTVPATRRLTLLEQLRRGQTTSTSVSLTNALKRVVAIRELGVHALLLPTVPPARLDALARYAILTPAATITRMPEERRLATLLAFARAALVSAHDDALTVLDNLIEDLVRQARLTAQRTRLRTLKDLDAAALQLSAVCARLIDPIHTDDAVRPAIFAEYARDTIAVAITQVEALARPADTTIQPEMIQRYTLVRRFMPTLLDTLTFEGTRAGEAVLDALAFLRAIEGQRAPDLHAAPRAVVPRAWRRFVLRSHSEVDRRAYTLGSV